MEGTPNRFVKSTSLGFLIATALLCRARCQTPGEPAAFEVASIKPSLPGSKTQIRRDPAGGFVAAGVSLKTLILLAYNIEEFQLLNVPGGVASERYDVVAKPPVGAKKEQTWVMLQALLSDRFRLTLHREDRQLTIYALVVSKKGLKILESKEPSGEADDSVKFGTGHMRCIKVPTADLALALSSVAGHRVIDRTGVSGKYDVTLDWAPHVNANPPVGAGPQSGADQTIPVPDGPSLFAALEDQLGLKLVPEKGPVEVLVVDHLETASPN